MDHAATPPLFQPHGHSEFLADGALVRIAVEGPFNAEGMDEFGARMRAIFATLPAGQAVVTLAEIRRTLVSPSDAWDRLERVVAGMQGGTHRIVGTAWIVGDDVEGRSLLVPKARRMYAAAGRDFEVFTSADAAEAWARARLSNG